MQALKIALRNQLIAANVNGGTAIYDTLALDGQAYPYLLMQYISGGVQTTTPLDTRREVWQVKAVSDDHTIAHSLAAAIRAALHRQPLSVTGWQHLWTVQLDAIWQVEVSGRAIVYHAGATYRIWLAEGS